MSTPFRAPMHRVLIIDDTPTIHQDFRRILSGPNKDRDSFEEMEVALFGTGSARPTGHPFEVDSAFQGEEGIERARAALKEGRPYSVAFVDVRMPPGLDGVETIEQLWREDPDLQVVLCSAYTDYSWEDVAQRLGISQRLLILRKPFDSIEVRQMAHALAEKWELLRRDRERMRELELANARLRQEAEERKALETQLAHAQRLEALGQLAAGMAHEVNNPLSFIIANLNHVCRELTARQSQEDVGELQEACHDALRGCERIRRLVQDVRIFGRSSTVSTNPVDVGEVMTEALAMASLSQVPGLRVVKELQPVPPALADEHGLGQVFLNLLINAAQALKGKGGPAEPVIRVVMGAHSDGRVKVEVQDNGPGIPPELLGRIFEPFFTTKPVGEGTGLGLSICHGIISGLGGELSVESQPGQGATFRVLLPAAPARSSRTSAPRSTEQARLASLAG
ncbi:ATP-binding protein [Archangium sp.]|uniref:ATP-binding protein n=1 Tax=Archangium sp. TaxID=1872627 RepID=UPI00286AA014|nr:ATP-binding protein [Archangium sp.]